LAAGHTRFSTTGITTVRRNFTIHRKSELLVTRQFGSEGIRASLKVLDPLEYKDRYAENSVTYVVNAANDEFFSLTGPLNYWDKLSGKKLLRILPDQPHGGAWGGWDSDEENTVSSKNKIL